MEITTQMIKELRAATSAPMLDCRKALQEADGNFDKAVDWLREKGMATAAKRADQLVDLVVEADASVGAEPRQLFGRSQIFRLDRHQQPVEVLAAAASTVATSVCSVGAGSATSP